MSNKLLRVAPLSPTNVTGESSPVHGVSTEKRILSVGLILAIWFICRWTFGADLAGSDDSFYIRYAHLMHRAPVNHWEGRWVYVWFLRSCFLGLGYSEHAAWIPGLFSSLLTLISVGWLARWPRYPRGKAGRRCFSPRPFRST